ncbi:MAG TPA: DNA polymerase IV [Candidatus Cloacimonetes bacterium]|nr:DNA polymerase IV [Candidatus Cloacimonadota bacterium]HEX37315.1 DNA polymerase IV [Candidatus Cloacimonadota bacterium]
MKENTPIKKIIHIDMDAFFAAVEVRDHPEYKGKPLIVGGDPGSRGVVATCSYEARKYGIHSAMASAIAYKLCPHAIFVHGRYEVYSQISKQIRGIFDEFSHLVEPVSIDEAYLDVTYNKKGMKSATLIAKEIKKRILEKTKLTASAGVSYNKFLAKVASDMEKPDGLVVIPPEKAKEVLEKLPIGKFYGIGKITEKKMKNLGIHCGKDLKAQSLEELVRHFGKTGKYYYYVVRGIDKREVTPERERKSIGNENTFAVDLDDPDAMKDYLQQCAEKIEERMKKHNALGRTITLKIKYPDFYQATRSRTINKPTNDKHIIYSTATKLLDETLVKQCRVRLLGISVSNLEKDGVNLPQQLTLRF